MHNQTFSLCERFRQRAWDVRRTVPVSLEADRGGVRPGRSAQVSLRLSGARKDLIEESRRHSTYRDISAFLRNVSTGWDPRAPVAAKAGIVLCWTGAHLGTKVEARNWETLERLLKALLGTGDLDQGLYLAEKHVLAALAAEGSPERPPLGLIGRRGAGREARRRLTREGEQNCKACFKVSGKRFATIKKIKEQEGYSSRSGYIRAVALGQNRSRNAFAEGAAVLFWTRSRAGEEIAPAEWLRLDGLLREHTGTYLFPSRSLPEISPDTLSSKDSGGDSSNNEFSDNISFSNSSGARSLWQAGAHLLASIPDAISDETGLPLS